MDLGEQRCAPPRGRSQPLHRQGGRHMGRWFGARLHRMLFAALASSIVITMGVVWVLLALTSEGPARWKRQMAHMEAFAGGRFAQVWDRPAERAELAEAVARAFSVRVELTDRRGERLTVAGPEAGHESPMVVPVLRGSGERLGTVTLSGPRAWAHPPLGGPMIALATAIAVLWLLAGLAARRLAKPLRELTRVAREIGTGKLESRARLRHGADGEVGELARAVNDMAERIEAQLGAQRSLLGDVSHELRTPLARVRLLVDIARDEAEAQGPQTTAPKRRDVLTEIEAEVVEMDGLVGELLAGARVDFGALSLRELDVRELAQHASARVLSPVGEAPVTVDVATDVKTVRADATLLARALGAMLDNARKHGGGAIALRVTREGGELVFAVEDEGPGFGPGEELRAFAPFYRGNGAAFDEARGVGLGLALVRRIAAAHGGRAFAENRAGARGARVSLAIPVDSAG